MHPFGFAFLGKRLEVAPPNQITLDDQVCSNIGYEFISYEPDKDVADTSGVIDQWATGTINSADYEIRATKISGTTPTGSPLSTWLSMFSGQSWTIEATALTRRCVLRIEIRRASNGVILDSCRVDLTATTEGGGEL